MIIIILRCLYVVLTMGEKNVKIDYLIAGRQDTTYAVKVRSTY